MLLVMMVAGCALPRTERPRDPGMGSTAGRERTTESPSATAQDETPDAQLVQLVAASNNQDEPSPDTTEQQDSAQDSPAAGAAADADSADEQATGEDTTQTADSIGLTQVIDAVHDSFPLIEAAYLQLRVADGNVLAAAGEFDTKVKAASENGPTGFYQTYRNMAGVAQPLFDGGEVFGGYRIGRGDFQPWYLERQTNDGGEFKVGMSLPFARNSDIDTRRAALWRSEYDQQITRPEIRAQLIFFTREAALAYWKWIAEGQKYFAEREWLALASERNERIQRRVEEGDLDPPEQTDNERAIAKRKSKLADQTRKVRQAAVKLSLFLRDRDGKPIVPTVDQIPDFPTPKAIDPSQLPEDVETALQQRPELLILNLEQRRLDVDYEEARNMGRPRLDGIVTASQDMGHPTSSKRDKSQFELEAGIFFDVPIQRRKALGKMQAVDAKRAQVAAKQQFTEEKISAGVQAAVVGLTQAFDQVQEATRAVTLANRMAEIERRKFEVGESDLLKVALREQYALDAIEGEVEALFNYFAAYSDYLAELAFDRPVWPAEQ